MVESSKQYSEIKNEGNPHPLMINKPNLRIPSRMAYDFPVGANVYCCNGGAVSGVTSNGVLYIDIKHKVVVPDIRLGREGNKLNKYFYDRYFISYNAANIGNEKVTSSEHQRLIYRYVSFIGGENKVKDGDNLQDFVDNALLQINNNTDKCYYIKTILKLNEKTFKLFLERGNFPYLSKVNNLTYLNGEDYSHEYVIYGQKRLDELNKDI